MATTYWRNNGDTAVAQVVTFTITAASTGLTATWTWTLTLDDGTTKTETYTEDGSPTVNEIASGLTDAWNNSTNPDFQKVTATVNAATVTLTADTAGVPFTASLADSGDGTHTGPTTSTASVGNTDYALTKNWSADAVPTTNDDVIIDGNGTTSQSILYGLNQASGAVDTYDVLDNYSGSIGRFENGIPYYLIIDPNSLNYYGRGSLAMINVGSANISPYIESAGTAQTGRRNVYLKGSNLATVEIGKGNVGIAPLVGETATVATLLVNYVTNVLSDCDVVVGSGVTLTTLTMSGGKVELNCAATTVTVATGSELTTYGSGAITTMNVQGTAYLNSTGTITTLNVYSGGVVDFTRDRSARTVSTINLYPGASIKYHGGITLTTRNLPGDGSVPDGTLTLFQTVV